jgi:hypothetical protein
MNDLTLCVLACAKNEKYSARLREFIDSYGFKMNRQDIVVKFVFLVEDEPRPDFLPNDYSWYNCPKTPLSCRFLSFLKDSEIDSKWIMQVDDDSSTDIDKTFELLEQFYEHQDSMILMGGRNTDLEPSQQNIVRIMKVENFFFGSKNISSFDTTPYFVHAWEPSIVSMAGAKKIKEWDRLNEYYELCMKYRPGFGDQTPYVAAKIAKVPIVECLFMSPFNKSADYSATKKGGRYSHIHYITDKWPGFEDFKNRMKIAKKIIPSGEGTKEDIWEFWGGPPGKEIYYGMMSLNEDGTVGIYKNDNESFWEFKGDSITLFNKKREPTSVLNKVGEREFVGKYIPDGKTVHKLVGI